MLTIGKLATAAGTTANTLRFYEREGLVPAACKGENGYRLYPGEAVSRVHFIRQAQHCGFTLAEIRELLVLPEQPSACCSDVRAIAISKKVALEAKIELMKTMSAELDRLIGNCVAETRPLDDCPILNAFKGEPRQPA